MEDEILEEITKEIDQGRERWRVPLFVVGAGVSFNKAPLMTDIFEYFCDESRSPDLPDLIRRDARRLLLNKQNRSRATASNFFGTLQTSKDDSVTQAWSTFTKEFLLGHVNSPKRPQIPLWRHEPTDFHVFIAEQVVRPHLPGVCVSLNYDGLTAKAVSRLARETNEDSGVDFDSLEFLSPCRILLMPDEIQQFYGRNSHRGDEPYPVTFYPIIKLRGDILNAICNSEGCRYFNERIPIYEIQPAGDDILSTEKEGIGNEAALFDPSEAESAKTGDVTEDERAYSEALKCPGCGHERNVEIDFPGFRTKEQETLNTIKMLYRFIVPTISCVVVCGVSGIWDHELVEFLRVCTVHRDVNIYCLDKEAPPLLQYQATWATEVSAAGRDSRFIPKRFDFSKYRKAPDKL